ncbi:MAG TPA: hypothetical protein EYP98_06350 [Planctomycetes bacterium]|nr:hypothetical protein [Planctomycetota bacterium]
MVTLATNRVTSYSRLQRPGTERQRVPTVALGGVAQGEQSTSAVNGDDQHDVVANPHIEHIAGRWYGGGLEFVQTRRVGDEIATR